jgi:D-glutamate cyclase
VITSGLIDGIEAVIHQGVGRGMDAVFRQTGGGLRSAVAALAASPSPKIGLITGFFVPGADPPAAETDGPAGSALLALGFQHAGLSCRLATDTLCAAACRAATDAAGLPDVPIDTVAPGQSVGALIDTWRREGIDWVVAVERCGPAADGRSYNMRGADISAYAAPLHQVFSAGPWRTIAVGDGGNEVGMGSVPRPLIAGHVPAGETIGCVIPADFLITAGVSHWGAYAILAALALQRREWRSSMLVALDPALDQAIVEAMVRLGPAVDGVSLRREATIDALAMDAHRQVMMRIRALVPEPETGNPALPASAN